MADENTEITNVLLTYTQVLQTEDTTLLNLSILLVVLLLQRKKIACRRKRERTRTDVFTTCVIPNYSLDEFRCHFRMTRVTMEVVYGEITRVLRDNVVPHLSERIYRGGVQEIPLQEKLTMFIWYISNKDVYRELANLFNCTESTCCEIVHAFVLLFTTHLLTQFIRWPNANEKREIAAYFEETKNFPNIMGFVDGCHIPVRKPRHGGQMYYNRKDFYSIVLQAVCREDMRFTDIFVGFPGRVHDARVFSSSPLFQHGAAMCAEYHLLGDSAYPNLSWLLTPFRRTQQLTPDMSRYNTVHSSMRITIERAFGLLKSRFRRLKYMEMYDSEFMAYTTAAACCLHNICIAQDDIEYYIEEEPEVPVAMLPPGIFNANEAARGVLKRNQIMNRLARH